MIVFHPATLAGFILWVLNHHQTPSILVICSDRQSFLQQLNASIHANHPQSSAQHSPPSSDQPEAPRDETDAPQQTANQQQQQQPRNQIHPLLTRALHILAASRTVKLAFCPSVSSLHAYLATLPQPQPANDEESRFHAPRWDAAPGTPILALVNPLALHRESAAYSAQNLGKAFAAGVEAAWRVGALLVVVECTEASTGTAAEDENIAQDVAMAESDAHEQQSDVNDGRAVPEETAERDPWDEDVPILNATSRAFGFPGERGWMGKKVKIREVAARWCSFQRLE